ncbi:uncharacterized protein LOC118675430 [Myotis myotis]|uniref:uncharacterized protein LOC118675430 n=1 Tax=Myotis myotis TaxID=51298 RepID=UPI00174906B8|nr:uncharacterized protein LOC118675430 [Myotis myotis]
MFLCCFPTFRGSGQKKAQSERCFCCYRLWHKRHRRSFLPFGKRQPQSCKEDVVEELDDGFTYTINRNKGLEHQTRNSIQHRSESSNEDVVKELVHRPHYIICRVRVQVHQVDNTGQCQADSSNEEVIEELVGGFNSYTSLHQGTVCQATDTIQWQTECAAELTLTLHEARRMRALQGGTLRKVAASMVPAFLGGNISHITTLMSIHPAFSRAQQFLYQLFTRAIASIMGTWPDQVQGFGRALHFPWFELKQASVKVHFPTSRHVARAHLVWIKLEHLEPTKTSAEGPPPGLQSTSELEEGPVQG